MQTLLHLYRILRVAVKQLMGREPVVLVKASVPLIYHGNPGYGGWSIPEGFIKASALVVDAGLGEDISFSQSLIAQYGCTVHGFDPTPRAIDYVERLKQGKFTLHKFGLGASSRTERFFLPNESANVSGSIAQADHVGAQEIVVELLSLDAMLKQVGANAIALLKLDIEGAEYEIIDSPDFEKVAPCVDVICIEFHHRWAKFGPDSTRRAVEKLERSGFVCVWRAIASNEEFTFVRAEKLHRRAPSGSVK
jgi:FkbM family methyltransferase